MNRPFFARVRSVPTVKIIVLIKQVPVVSAMKLDPETKTLKRQGVPLEVSAFDVRALVKAVELKQAHGAEVVAMTLGPPQAKDALRECLALGADRAILVTDRLFAGSDTLATARALAASLRREGFDLILCGKSSVDAETGQVGPEVAEILDIPQITFARSLALHDGIVSAERELDEGTESVEAPLPCLVSAVENLAPERFATPKALKEAESKTIVEWNAHDLDGDPARFGQGGSPTWVAGVEAVAGTRTPVVIEGGTAAEACEKAAKILKDKGVRDSTREAVRVKESPAAPAGSGGGPLWVVAEVIEGDVRPVTFELLVKAGALARRAGRILEAVVIGEAPRDDFRSLAAHGAERILHVAREGLTPYVAESHAEAMAAAIRLRRPSVVLLPSTTRGRDFGPRAAARLGLGLTGDCIDLDLDAEGRLVMLKPAFGGSVVAPILSKTCPEMATVRPGMFEKRIPDSARRPHVEVVDPGAIRPSRLRVSASSRRSDADGVALDDAPIVVGVGRGIGGPERLEAIRAFARRFAAPLGATRVVTDAGWLPKQHQIGLTGRAIAPRLYIALGISGAFEHMVGLRRAGTILAVNKNPKAPIFKTCDIGIVGDVSTVLPELGRALESVLPQPKRSG